MDTSFDDSQNFVASSIFNYLAPPDGTEAQRVSAIAKRFPRHFIVREKVPGLPDRFLSIGRESDYPTSVLNQSRHADSIVIATLVKEKLVTWAAIDWLAKLLTKALGREIRPEQIRHCGMKDRWAVTAQSVVISGVTVAEMRNLSWPHSPGRAGFFMKDIRWHDARRRVHPVADEKRNRVFTEAMGQVLRSDRGLTREAILSRAQQRISAALKRDIPTRDLVLRGDYLHVARVTASELASVNWDGCDIRLSNVRISKSNALSKGDHRQNRFELRIVVADKTQGDVAEYLKPRIERLGVFDNCIPNAIGFQRLAARQLGHKHGRTLVTGEYQPPAGVHKFGSASEAALYRFLHETSGRENEGAEKLRRDIEACWLYDFPGMVQRLDRQHRALNMSVEFKIAERLADIERYRGDFEEVVRSMHEEVSMWVAAWQSWWWNQVLAKKLPHWTREAEEAMSARNELPSLQCTCAVEESETQPARCHKRWERCRKCKLEEKIRRFNLLEKGIPMLMDSPQSREYYGRLAYCAQGMADLNKADAFVTEQFLRPRGNTPWRKAFMRVDNLEYSVGSEVIDEVDTTVVDITFDLPSGAYATVLLSLLFELQEPNKGAVRNPDSEGALHEETE